MRYSLGTIAFVLNCFLGLAQDAGLHFEYFGIENGLCHGRLTSLLQDQQGFLWIGSENGLMRYDGISFQCHWPQPVDGNSLSSAWIMGLDQDKSGRIWIRTLNGINRYDPVSGTFHHWLSYPDHFSTRKEAEIPNSLSNGAEKVWYFTPKGALSEVDLLTGKTESLPFSTITRSAGLDPSLSAMPFAGGTFLKESDSTAWISTTHGLFHFQFHTHSFRFFSHKQSSLPSLLGGDPNRPFFGIWGKGLFQLNPANGVVSHWPLGDSAALSNVVYDVLPRPDNRLWLATEAGLMELDTLKGQYHQISLFADSRNSFAVHQFLEDRSGIIWIATENGLVKLDPHLQGFSYTALEKGEEAVYENVIYDLAYQPEKQRIIAISRAGWIYALEEKSVKQTKLPVQESQNKEPTRLFKDSKNNWWLCTRFDLYRLDPDDLSLTSLPIPPRRQGRRGLFWTAAEDHLGRLWFGISRDGILIYDPNSPETAHNPRYLESFPALQVSDIQMDTLHRKVWVGTDGEGLWEGELNTLQFRQLNQAHFPQLPSDQVLYLEQDEEGKLWLGSLEGLCRYDWTRSMDQAFVCLTAQDGLPVNLLEGLQLDQQGYLWAGTSGKLIRIHPQTLDINIFDHRYGVNVSPFPISAIHQGANGKMYAGVKYGFLSWSPEKLKRNEKAADVVLTEVRVLGKTFSSELAPEYLTELHLQHWQNSVSFGFAALNFTLPDFNRYAWTLEGWDKNWTKGVNQQLAIYTRIPPGEYLFKVKAANNEGIWGKERMLKLVIRPALWQTWWFKCLLALLIGGTIWSIYLWRIKQIKQQEALNTSFQKRIAEVEMTALRAQMNPHFVFNCLNSINRFIQLSDSDTASDYLAKFSRLIRLVLDNSREEKVSLDQEIQALRLYIELEVMRFTGRFTYAIEVDEQLDLLGIDIPPLLIQPYVENAIWHGLMHKEDNQGLLQVSFRQEGSFLLIQIRDNGIGQAAAAELNSKSATRHKSHGMALTQERLDMIREMFGREISVVVSDLTDSVGQPTGTEVLLKIAMT